MAELSKELTAIITEDSNELGMFGSTGFLPRLQLCASNSKVCVAKKISANHYAYVEGTELIDVGTSPDVLNLGWRPLALDMSGDKVISSHNKESDLFKEIVARSSQPNSNCTWGAQYLVYIPEIDKFAGLHFGSATARRESPEMFKLIGRWVNLNSQLIDNGTHVWSGMTVKESQTPHELPDEDRIRQEIMKFKDTSSEEAATPEVANTTTTTRER